MPRRDFDRVRQNYRFAKAELGTMRRDFNRGRIPHRSVSAYGESAEDQQRWKRVLHVNSLAGMAAKVHLSHRREEMIPNSKTGYL